MICGLHETQDMFISSDIEVLPIPQTREAYEGTALMTGQFTIPSLQMPSLAGHILFADDDADTRELVSYLLAKSHFSVTVAENSDSALLLDRTNRFDLY